MAVSSRQRRAIEDAYRAAVEVADRAYATAISAAEEERYRAILAAWQAGEDAIAALESGQ